MMHLKNITAGNPKTKEQYQLQSNLTSNGFIQMMEKLV
ncbi:tail fiber assembly protein [Shigella boydii]|uniref:Tail fiber assembly protein n=1 Tax=Shigella boydii TaxID=621 RepID=A0A2X2J500_SHIBO|nr:tail fiber assembly protein [Shigella boydii]